MSADGSLDDSSADYSRLILKNSYWSLHNYKWRDGTPAKNADIFRELHSLPENRNVLKLEAGTRIGAIGIGVIMLGTAIVSPFGG
jgi:hypothetical protein